MYKIKRKVEGGHKSINDLLRGLRAKEVFKLDTNFAVPGSCF